MVVERVSPGTFRDKLEMVNVAMEKYNGDGVLFQVRSSGRASRE